MSNTKTIIELNYTDAKRLERTIHDSRNFLFDLKLQFAVDDLSKITQEMFHMYERKCGELMDRLNEAERTIFYN